MKKMTVKRGAYQAKKGGIKMNQIDPRKIERRNTKNSNNGYININFKKMAAEDVREFFSPVVGAWRIIRKVIHT